MKKLFMIAAAFLLVMKTAAQTSSEVDEYVTDSFGLLEEQPIEPSYLDDTFTAGFWDSNWFLSVKGGMSAFVGKPIGHGDFYDRKKVMANFSLGKWFTPQAGGRIAIQGFKLADSDLRSCTYQNIHADFLYNVASHFRPDADVLPRWDFVPYVGCGIVRNDHTGEKPFAVSYGLICRYRIARRIHLSAELGNTMTWQSFDGKGTSGKFGDNLLQASAGLDLTIGKTGWKSVIDPKPYIYQNDLLMSRINSLREENARLGKENSRNRMAIAEMHKILEIEGLLDKYTLAMHEDDVIRSYPKNNYSGLNSLRARLRNRNWNGDKENYIPILKDSLGLTDSTNAEDSLGMAGDGYFNMMQDGTVYIGSPIYFFFRIGTDELTETAQTINIKELARCAKKHNLRLQVVGAADSQTGTVACNDSLSVRRADRIARLLVAEGISEDSVRKGHRGGIDAYTPLSGNRNTCVMLYTK